MNTKKLLILIFVFLFMQIGSLLLFHYYINQEAFIFTIGYFTYPLIKYLQS